MNRAGLETMLMNYYRHIDRQQIQFDFLTHRKSEGAYDSEISRLGGKVYHAPRLYPQNYVKYFRFMNQFFLEHPEYKIVHSHIDSMSYLPLLAAKHAGIPIRIAHSHNTSIDLDYKFPLKEIFRYKLINVANEFCACGQEAGEYLFRGKRAFKYVPNAIDKKKFLFNEKIRINKRKEFGLEGKLVIGNIGRLEKQKNQRFLLDSFAQLVKIHKNSILLIIGTGSRKKTLLKYAENLGIKEKVFFLGSRNDVDQLYNVMDVFMLPSLYEGIPVVGIEAQYEGVPCIFSDKVPKEAVISSKVKVLSLRKSSEQWAKEILLLHKREQSHRKNNKIIKEEFDINKSFKILQNYYMDLYKKIGEIDVE